MDKEAYLKHKNKELKEKGFSNVQSQQIANSLYMQEGGSYSYQKTGNQNIAQSDVNKINQATGITFTPEFSNAYFSTQNAPISQTSNNQMYSPKPVQDITSDGLFTNRKVWYTDRAENFLGKAPAVEGKDYTTIPYSQWEAYQSSPEYMQYMAPQQTQVNSTSTASMQGGGQASVSPYAMNYPSFMNNFAPSPYIQRPQAITEPDFTGSPFSSTSFTSDPTIIQQQLGSPYQFSDELAPQSTQTVPTKQYYNDISRYNIVNPFGGVGLESALNYAGQGFGSGNNFQGGLGAGLSVLKGARNFLTGYASGKESDRVKREQFDDLYNPKTNYQYAQQGKEVTNAEFLTGQYAVDEGIGSSYNLEHGEFIKRAQTGEVQQVVGEKHIKNGKEAEGVNVNLENGDKVLSDYTKIPAKNVKELKERYDLSLRKGATFADAQKAYDKKLGIQKETDELTTLIEKYGKNTAVKDETTKRLNDVVLSKEIEASKKKSDLLGSPQSMMFEDLFSIQESLPKKGNGELLDKNGKPLKDSETPVKQEGGAINDLANRYGISPERAQELIALQEGGQPAPEQQTAEAQQPSQEQVMQFIAQSLQNGATPEEVLAQLVQNNIPQEIAQQLIQQTIGQLQQSPQEEQGGTLQEPVEEAQGMAQEGGEKKYMQQAGFSFATRYAPPIDGYDVTGSSVVNKDMLTGVEPIQSYTGTGYGQQMANVDDLINIHSDWYFTTPEKKEAFKEASKKEGEQPEIKAFQTAYNAEIIKRAEKAGVPKKDLSAIIDKVGFNNSGVKNTDGLFGAFTSTRPLYSFEKSKDGEVKIQATTPTAQTTDRNITKNVLPAFAQNLRLSPSALDPLNKEQIALGRAEGTKLTTEPFLASMEAQRQADVARYQASGLPPQIQESLLAQGLATSQISANDAIAKVEMANQANRAQVDQFNINQRAKEDLTNAQFSQQYQSQVLGGLNAYERDLRNYYNQFNSDNETKYRDTEAINLINARNSQYQYLPGQGVEFLNNKPSAPTINTADPNWYKKATPEQIDAYVKSEIEKDRLTGLKNYKTTVKTV